MSRIRQQTAIVLSAVDIVSLDLSIPCWDALAREPARCGFVRHGGAVRAVDNVGPNLKPSYSRHARDFLALRGDSRGDVPRTLLAWGTRNTLQNLGQPGWDRRCTPRLLCRPDEPWRHWTYSGLGCRQNGRLEMLQVQFTGKNEAEASPVSLDVDEAGASDLQWIVTGQPLVWNGELVPFTEIAAATYDLRHLWALRWEDWQQCAADREIHDELMSVVMRDLSLPEADRGRALCEAAERHHLPETSGYLHSSLGITAAGELTLLMKTGSLTEIGTTQRALGAQRAILLDNGGSVGAAYWSRFAWQQKGWEAIAEQPVFLGNGSYFRPRGHAVLIAELSADLPEGPTAHQLEAIQSTTRSA